MTMLSERSAHESEPSYDGPALSPAQYALALVRLHEETNLGMLTAAATDLGNTALGQLWVALLVRGSVDAKLVHVNVPKTRRSGWPVDPPDVTPESAFDFFLKLGDQVKIGPGLMTLLDSAVPLPVLTEIEQALPHRMAVLAPVLVDGQPLGLAVVLVRDGDLPEEAVQALAAHLASAARSILTIERARGSGDLDPDTQLLGRTAFEERAGKEVSRARRYERPLSLVALTLPVDDADALRLIGHHVQSLIRDTDILARLDATRLALLLPETTHEGATILAERIADANPGLRYGLAFCERGKLDTLSAMIDEACSDPVLSKGLSGATPITPPPAAPPATPREAAVAPPREAAPPPPPPEETPARRKFSFSAPVENPIEWRRPQPSSPSLREPAEPWVPSPARRQAEPAAAEDAPAAEKPAAREPEQPRTGLRAAFPSFRTFNR